MKKKFLLYGGLVMIFIVSLLSMITMILSLHRLQQRIYNEHDAHQMDLAETLDINIQNLLLQFRTELQAMTQDPWIMDAEDVFHNTGETSQLRFELQNCFLLRTDLVCRILALQDGEMVLCSNCDGDCGFHLMEGSDDGDVWLCTEDDDNYIAITAPSHDGRLTYAVLIQPEQFFERMVPRAIYNECWIVLYDAGNGYSLQNTQSQPLIRIMTQEEMAARQDGYSIILRWWQSGEIGTENYSYVETDGRDTLQRMLVLPDQLTNNGIFTIGIAVDTERIVVPNQRNSWQFFISAFTLTCSLALFFHLGLLGRRRRIEANRRIAALEKERDIAADLLEQQTQMAHHQRLEYMGLLTSTVAHDLNNMLTPSWDTIC